ncbi:ribonuclease J [Ancylobacter defluvii]|uniref:RNase J family beta-CASP ribonuclease n=1 Tax=Ancylobacter defluvii TaxID=1282440 RepID=A0A9W6JWZ4_9HYPH|nr:ribonuclease J [Ancylobacter defluvii]MBS7587948.1 ribonuclease J [Ancylobacter defluvii]GLK83630.1 RNase J family beta-CASP ribonuclease [Ancylobacter defluvii]
MIKSSDELVFAALGGVGEIGMNLGIYGFGPRHKRQWLVVDLGISFAGPDVPGIDIIMPDIAFLDAERERIVGLVLTHGHEDHVGALVDLWPRLGCPVYTTPFTAALAEARRLGEPGAPKIPFRVVPTGGRAQIGPFDVEFVPVAHSIPDSHALAIRTSLGLVVHTGDWKIDPTPVVGNVTDPARFTALGDEGVRAVICDSTNAIRDGVSPSEAEVGVVLADIMRASPNRVAVTTFASNVARIRSVAEAAHSVGREVVLVGRAMERVITVAREQRLLDGLPPFRSVDAYGFLPRDKVVAILTGSQGEPRAALARIADDDHPEIALSPGDHVIFSSRTIPGNERAVNRIINALVLEGVKVTTDRDALVHVSGHPRRGELEQMYKWLRPRISVPVHGEPLHLSEHADLARRMGAQQVVRIVDGDVVRLIGEDPSHDAEVIEEIPVGRLHKDGLVLVGDADPAIAERRRLSFAGVISVAVAMTAKGDVVGDPMIDLTGIPQTGIGGKPLDEVVEDAVLDCLDNLPKPRRRDPDAVADTLTRAVRSQVNAAWGKKPLCHVLVITV